MRREEDRIQEAIVDYVRTVAPSVLIFSVPNEGERNAAQTNALKQRGLTPGIPDLVILAPFGKAYLIEVKTKAGALRKEQIAIRDRLMNMVVPCIVARSIEDVRRALHHWQIPTREAVA